MTTTSDSKMTRPVIIVGYDGSDCASEAIQDLARAGLPEVGTAVVLSVVNSAALPVAAYSPAAASIAEFSWTTPQTWQELIDEATREARQLAEAGAGLLRKALPSWDVTSDHGIDSPYLALIDTAEKRRANLIVLGSHGRSAFRRFFLGSTSQFVLGHAGCSVRIGRRLNVHPETPRRLLVGVDGSAGSDAAVDEICHRHWPAGTEVRVLMSVDFGLAAALRRREQENRERHAMTPKQILEAATELHQRSGLKAAPALEQGDPKHVIVEQAERWGADTIFLGATGHGPLQRFLLGSVSAAVAARAHCSVEVVRPTASTVASPR